MFLKIKFKMLLKKKLVYQHETSEFSFWPRFLGDQTHGKETKIISVGNNLIFFMKESLIRFHLLLSGKCQCHCYTCSPSKVGSSTSSSILNPSPICTNHCNHGRVQLYLMSKFLTSHSPTAFWTFLKMWGIPRLRPISQGYGEHGIWTHVSLGSTVTPTLKVPTLQQTPLILFSRPYPALLS